MIDLDMLLSIKDWSSYSDENQPSNLVEGFLKLLVPWYKAANAVGDPELQYEQDVTFAKQAAEKADPQRYIDHVSNVAYTGMTLARRLHQRIDVVGIACYLHDIEKGNGKSKGNHAAAAAQTADRLFMHRDYPDERIDAVMKAIGGHSLPYNQKDSVEVNLVRSADGIVQIHQLNCRLDAQMGTGANPTLDLETYSRKFGESYSKIMPDLKYIIDMNYSIYINFHDFLKR